MPCGEDYAFKTIFIKLPDPSLLHPVHHVIRSRFGLDDRMNRMGEDRKVVYLVA
jgi:hypothetical protein